MTEEDMTSSFTQLSCSYMVKHLTTKYHTQQLYGYSCFRIKMAVKSFSW